MVGSCRKCENCSVDLENYFPHKIPTYNGYNSDGTLNFGGYSHIMVFDEHFVLCCPKNLLMDVAPLLYAGITTYSPLKYFGLDKPGMHIGVVDLGRLGHMVVMFAKEFGTKGTFISTSAKKNQEAIERLGADSFLIIRDPKQMKDVTNTLDGIMIIDTISVVHSILPLLILLKSHGKLVMVGAPENPVEYLPVFALFIGRKLEAGSCIGGTEET
ncbi:8-hydroxygeraniol dehydrogenase-like [Solanum pennellii]|uniref:8-hydroxygeraniol dehydrogenase-like n=1 Tax=Solanum pennellii TaxID=28526 RepID=A0ABM1GTT9_SOLPN|nr:8-hydroxygeraniol dehydrogenase-like [Solanum pennellii]